MRPWCSCPCRLATTVELVLDTAREADGRPEVCSARERERRRFALHRRARPEVGPRGGVGRFPLQSSRWGAGAVPLARACGLILAARHVLVSPPPPVCM